MKRQTTDWEKTFVVLVPDKKNLYLGDIKNSYSIIVTTHRIKYLNRQFTKGDV